MRPGRVLARASESYPVAYPNPGWAEQDPADWERALRLVIGAVVQDVGAARVAAIGIAGQVDGIVPVDASGAAIGPGIIWMDRRATQEAAALAATLRRRGCPRPHRRQHRCVARRTQDRLAARAGAGDRTRCRPTAT